MQRYWPLLYHTRVYVTSNSTIWRDQPATSQVESDRRARRARSSRERLRQHNIQHELLQLGLLLNCPEENEEHVLTACICALHTLHQKCVRLCERYSSSQYDDEIWSQSAQFVAALWNKARFFAIGRHSDFVWSCFSCYVVYAMKLLASPVNTKVGLTLRPSAGNRRRHKC